jgi:hypothetical protein
MIVMHAIGLELMVEEETHCRSAPEKERNVW